MRFLGLRKLADSEYEPIHRVANDVLPPDDRSLREVARWQKAQERLAAKAKR